MSWAKFDDGYLDHPKLLQAGPWAELLDVRAVIWCAKYETDGHIPKAALPGLGRGIPRVSVRVAALVEVGRWIVNPKGGWLVHNFLDYNPSKAEREDIRRSGRERQAAFRTKRNAVTNPFVTNGTGSVSVSKPKTLARCARCEKLTIDCQCALNETTEEPA